MARKTIKKDWQSYSDGDITIVNNVWNQGDYVNGKDYSQKLAYNPADLNTNLKFVWNWPSGDDDFLSFPEVIAGYKPWSESGSNDLTAKLSKISTLKVDIDYDIGGQTDTFNVAFDMWLTDKKHGGADNVTAEVSIWTHSGDMTPEGESIGTYKRGNLKGEIFVAEDYGGSGEKGDPDWQYITLVLNKDLDDGRVDIGKFLDKLVDKGLLDESNVFNGYEFGAQVTGGKGNLKIHEIDHSFATGGNKAAEQHHFAAAADDFYF